MKRKLPTADERSSGWQYFYAIILEIPAGCVATYGQVARRAGKPGHARQVGYALAALREDQAERTPWHRVINAKGEVSHRRRSSGHRTQQVMLQAEGIEFNQGRVDLRVYRWRPDLEAE